MPERSSAAVCHLMLCHVMSHLASPGARTISPGARTISPGARTSARASLAASADVRPSTKTALIAAAAAAAADTACDTAGIGDEGAVFDDGDAVVASADLVEWVSDATFLVRVGGLVVVATSSSPSVGRYGFSLPGRRKEPWHSLHWKKRIPLTEPSFRPSRPLNSTPTQYPAASWGTWPTYLRQDQNQIRIRSDRILDQIR